ncbi:low molecular weight phosphatase family protein [Myceligenerans sp. TRM 65318]|uniref:Low molecular weight phosphatase family protein n=2 Tax=Myceligenerans pegani TaxID=2776917 RepID=A0ABR9MV16_9MICO|nr:low molecular weight phosphatase family protein [Myceligenerans sp. TRM 65318]MBE3017491.1 low molecular weight phosphatase family protein [Myceligenerans sp. TRM 65318]
MPYTVLTVCTGNICRSPAAAALLAGRLDDSVRVSSAGTGALVGHPVPERMAELVAAAGGDVSRFAARQATPEMIREADLILALTVRHRAWVVDQVPAAVRRTLTLRELGRLVGTIPAGAFDPSALPDDAARLAALVPLALGERPRHAGARHDDDVVDPYGRPASAYRASFDQITEGLAPLLRAIRPRPRWPSL